MCSAYACSYGCMKRELDETGWLAGNTVVLRERLIVLRQSYGQSSPCAVYLTLIHYRATHKVAATDFSL